MGHATMGHAPDDPSPDDDDDDKKCRMGIMLHSLYGYNIR